MKERRVAPISSGPIQWPRLPPLASLLAGFGSCKNALPLIKIDKLPCGKKGGHCRGTAPAGPESREEKRKGL